MIYYFTIYRTSRVVPVLCRCSAMAISRSNSMQVYYNGIVSEFGSMRVTLSSIACDQFVIKRLRS